ncbi:MAG: VOC family protein [Pseudomonadota bacterium]
MTLTIGRLEHVNVRTAKLDAMIAWYKRILNMDTGPRPDFDFPGAWLYADGSPFIHLVGVASEPSDPQKDLKVEHFAFSARGLEALLARAEAEGEKTGLRRVPGFPIVQVNLWDPDGNHLHIDFDVAEADALGLE